MPDQENVSMEKVALSSADFAEDLGGNTFGIQDTQVLASKDLQNFLLSDPSDIRLNNDDNNDTNKNPLATSKEDKQKNTPQNQNRSFEEDKNNPKKVQTQEEIKEEDTKGRDTLENLLFNENKDEDKGGTPVVDPKEATQSSDDDTYHTLAKDFLRLGVFTKNSDDETEETINVKTPEEFLERFSLEKKKGAINILDNFLSQFGEDRRKMFDSIFVNGVDPQEYLRSFAKVEALGNLDLSSESNQERVVRSYYQGLKWDDNKINNRIQKLKDYGDLEDEAKTYHEVLLNKEKETTAELDRKKLEEKQKKVQKEQQEKQSYLKILGDKLKAQELDGIPVNEKEAQATLDYLTEKKYKLESGELLSEFDKDLLELNRPENHELKVKLGLLLRKKLDLTSVKKASVSKKSDQLFTLSTKNAKQQQQQAQTKSFF